MDGIEGSPIAPCEGCELNEQRDTRFTKADSNKRSKGCIIDTDIENLFSFPKRKSRLSLSNKNDKRDRNRLLLSPFSMETFMRETTQHELTIEQEESESN